MKNVFILIIILILSKWYFSDLSISVPNSDISFDYIIEYSGNANKNDSLPTLIVLHGNGDTASNFYNTALNEFTTPARIILIQGPLSYGKGNAWPWRPENFLKYGKAISETAELLMQKYNTTGKPILLGFSGGAMMAYYQAVRFGDIYSYIFPVSGKASLGILGDGANRIGAKVYAYHGNNDSVVPFSGGQNGVNILKQKGVEAIMTPFEGNHHGIFTNAKTMITHSIEEKLKSL